MRLLKCNLNHHNTHFDHLIVLLLFYDLMKCSVMNYKILLLCNMKGKTFNLLARHLHEQSSSPQSASTSVHISFYHDDLRFSNSYI